ncbi:MAG: PbsX family transcriptional regulator [Ramlibacter sp.]|uniref:AbrB/MazE/SpoVT family DNA-binding domain-containing protein n=1 Tax=Ramlibacter sp. TaxID=1917967 RepID=UPI002625A7E7|nr:PbsX family transcriptional regulator [Ramlibacter sp.]MDH4377831.1 PbsX family transcriptional regulator [Ramlibacter sp.]
MNTLDEPQAMETVIRKWGNSPALLLPTSVLKEAGYQLGQKVDLVVSRGRIIIQTAKKVEYDIDALVNGIHASKVHDEVTSGPPVGKEAL